MGEAGADSEAVPIGADSSLATESSSSASDSVEPVLYEVRGASAWLVLNRPERLNAVSEGLYAGLMDGLRKAEQDDDVRVVVITGAGRAFCAGADLKAHADADPTMKERRRYARTAARANRRIQRCGKPVIAAVNGHAIGGGLEMALSCDFIIVASEAKLRFPELALGTFVGGGVLQTLPERVGMSRARELLLLGDFFSGADAAQMGLANRAVPAAHVAGVVTALAERLSQQAPVPMRLARALLRRSRRMGRRALMDAEVRGLVHCMGTDDWREGVRAFREKRSPRYTGR